MAFNMQSHPLDNATYLNQQEQIAQPNTGT